MARLDVYYMRYMDDILVLVLTRWTPKRAIRELKAGLTDLGLTTHPGKTWEGKTDAGVDVFWYYLRREGITVASATVTRSVTWLHRLNEHTRRSPSRASAGGVYVSRWWALGGRGA